MPLACSELGEHRTNKHLMEGHKSEKLSNVRRPPRTGAGITPQLPPAREWDAAHPREP